MAGVARRELVRTLRTALAVNRVSAVVLRAWIAGVPLLAGCTSPNTYATARTVAPGEVVLLTEIPVIRGGVEIDRHQIYLGKGFAPAQ